MKKIYLVTVIAIVITMAIASHLLAVGALGPATPGLLSRLRSCLGGTFRRLKGRLDDWIAAAIARRARQAATFALRHFSDRELRDLGLYRDSMACDPRLAGCEPQAAVGDTASIPRVADARPR